MSTMQITYKLRLRDTHAAELNRQARAVNYVWNYLNQTQRKAARECRRWLSGFDLMRLTVGTSAELDLHAHTIQRVCRAYADARRIHKKPWLRWRGHRSLGWVPFNTGHVAFDGEAFTFRGVRYVTMHLREIPEGALLGAGSFNADARGRWYLNVPVEVPEATSASLSDVGIDLGLKDFAALSTGETIPAPRLYRASEAALATAQRARKTKRTRQIHAKAANRRKDFLHKHSLAIVQAHGRVFVGNVSASKLARTSLAKSVLDAGWSTFRNMLRYKSRLRGGGVYLEVSEYLSSQVCSACGSLPASRPKGIADLRQRVWRCSDCGTVHDRDVNAARNILAVGQHSLGGGAHG
jgi:putative transposase